MKKPRVLFIVSEVGHYVEFKKIFQTELVKEKIEPVILFERDGFDLKLLFEKELKDYNATGQKAFFLPKKEYRHSLLSRMIWFPIYCLDKVSSRFHLPIRKLRSVIHFFFEITTLRTHFKNRIKALNTFFKQENIDSIIIGEENVLLDTFVYKRASEHRKVYVSPYTIPNPKEMATGAYKEFPSKSLKAKVISLVGARFCRTIEGTTYLLVNFAKIFAFYSVGYFPKNPWVLNDDTADLVLLESQEMADTYLRNGVRPERFSIIGSFNDDQLVEMTKRKESLKIDFQKKYSLDLSKPIVLVGFPPNQYPWKTGEYPDYETIIETYASCLSEFLDRYSIVVTKHPRIKQSLEALSQKGLIVVDQPTIEILPFADLYIASASATIRWGIASGVPVINYDVYRHFYEDYDGAFGVKTVRAKNLFQSELSRMLDNPTYYEQTKKAQQKDSQRWGLLDGQVAQRFTNLVSQRT